MTPRPSTVLLVLLVIFLGCGTGEKSSTSPKKLTAAERVQEASEDREAQRKRSEEEREQKALDRSMEQDRKRSATKDQREAEERQRKLDREEKQRLRQDSLRRAKDYRRPKR